MDRLVDIQRFIKEI
ncbi:hypothetical protein M5689_025017 [Euphorbia peplus]|nr:hypothetical protein M5689_025017 [Euphorbia peplus]